MDRDLKTPTNSYSVKRRVVLCILLAFTSLLAGCDNQTPQEFHTLALQNYEQGKLEDASIQIKNAIRLAPTSAEYRFLLAQIATVFERLLIYSKIDSRTCPMKS